MTQDKASIREDMLFQLKKQDPAARMAKSLKIKDLALKSSFYQKAASILFYLATPTEVETRALILEALNEGKRVALPCIDPVKDEIVPVSVEDIDHLVKGSFGILEPVRTAQNTLRPGGLDLIFVPGIAFDRKGKRLGRGRGYYDRFLGLPGMKAIKVGLAFDFQVLDSVPFVPGQDVALDAVLSA